jgi:hypothetical protein
VVTEPLIAQSLETWVYLISQTSCKVHHGEDVWDNDDGSEGDDQSSEVRMLTVDGLVFHMEMYDEQSMMYMGWFESEDGPVSAGFSFASLADVL